MTESANQKIIAAISNYKHIIWDWNGTLVDDVDVAVEAINVLLREHQLPLVTATTYRDIFSFPVKDYYEKLGFNFQKTSFESLCDRFVQEYNVHRAGLASLFHGVPDLLKTIKESKTQSILSAAAQWHLDEITKHFEVHHLFHHRYGIDNHYASSKLERGKQLIAASNISERDTILIGDTDHDF
ncbi:MAG TPA: HAD hydrolase-like protein, partial [Bdellovibrio sp.]|nr:HAD hydrolase-like protein [Bdellovibrio sp.]